MPTCSVIVPVYNAERFLNATLASLREQTFSDLEIVVVDDCSTDASMDIVAQHACADGRVRAVSMPRNSGGSAAPTNLGIDCAEGEFLGFLDHDDLFHPRKLERALEVFTAYPETEVVFFDVYGMSVDGVPHAVSAHEKTNFIALAAGYLSPLGGTVYQCSPRYVGAMARQIVGLSTQGIVVRKSALLRADAYFPTDSPWCQDIAAFFRLAACTNMKYVHEPMAYFRHTPGSRSSRTAEMKAAVGLFHSENYRRLAGQLLETERRDYRRSIAEIFAYLGWHHRREPRKSLALYWRALRWSFQWKLAFALVKAVVPRGSLTTRLE